MLEPEKNELVEALQLLVKAQEEQISNYKEAQDKLEQVVDLQDEKIRELEHKIDVYRANFGPIRNT